MYQILVGILRFSIGWKFSIDVQGLENIPEKGPALIVFNHCGIMDTLAIMFSIHRKLYPLMAYEWRFNPFVVLFWIAGVVIFIKRGKRDSGALERCIGRLMSGKFVVISPEGTRSVTTTLNTGKYGTAYVADRARCSVIPLGIVGACDNKLSMLWRSPLLKKIPFDIKIGKPFRIDSGMELGAAADLTDNQKTALQTITNISIMSAIARLIPPSMRGKFQ
jgi:1-acyl-sn-glycerol-3-phosphate acyltransferase